MEKLGAKLYQFGYRSMAFASAFLVQAGNIGSAEDSNQHIIIIIIAEETA